MRSFHRVGLGSLLLLSVITAFLVTRRDTVPAVEQRIVLQNSVLENSIGTKASVPAPDKVQPQHSESPAFTEASALDRHEPHTFPATGHSDWLALANAAGTDQMTGESPAILSRTFSLVNPSSLPQVNEKVEIELIGGIVLHGTVTTSVHQTSHGLLGLSLNEHGPGRTMHLTFDPSLRLLNGAILAPKGQLSYRITAKDDGTVRIEGVDREVIIPSEDGYLPLAAADDLDLTPEGEGDEPPTMALDGEPQSLAGATKVLWLNATAEDGDYVSGTVWNASFNGGNPLYAPRAGDNVVNNMQIINDRVAETFRRYAVNVTTLKSVYDATAPNNRFQVRITGNNWYGSAGGVSYISVFGSESYKLAWVFSGSLANSPKYVADAISHEAGHALGLYHDGTASVGYYTGHGDWAPIMGVGYYKTLIQWSKGEYTGANNQEDDLQKIANFLPVRTDDFVDINQSTPSGNLTFSSGVAQEVGVITFETDADTFGFIAPGTSATISIQAQSAISNSSLNVKASILNSSQTVIASSDDLNSLNAVFSNLTLTPGSRYFIHVSGAAHGTFASNGYSAYASVGQYSVTVSANGLVTPTITPTPGATFTFTPTPTATNTPPPASTSTPTRTPTFTATAIATNTPTIAPTSTPTFTPTSQPTATNTPIPPTPSPTTTPTATPTSGTEQLVCSPIIKFTRSKFRSYVPNQDIQGTVNVLNQGTEVVFTGNIWKKYPYTYRVTNNTKLLFDFMSESIGHLQGISLDNSSVDALRRTFAIYGTSAIGIRDFVQTYPPVAPQWKSYSLPVGDFYTISSKFIGFVNDHDVAPPAAVSHYRNVRLCERIDRAPADIACDMRGSCKGRQCSGFLRLNNSDPKKSRTNIEEINVSADSGATWLGIGKITQKSISGRIVNFKFRLPFAVENGQELLAGISTDRPTCSTLVGDLETP